MLVVGGGGREHALCRAVRASPMVGDLLAAPGNAGIADLAECVDVPLLPATLANVAMDRRIDLTIVGPEAPLCAGIADEFARQGLRVFGPTQAAAKIEGSKVFSKQLFARHGIPSAGFAVFDELEPALRYVDQHVGNVVVKADGLAAGKGVVVAQNEGQAHAAVRAALAEGAWGEAGKHIVIEERLQGVEASLMVLTDGTQILPLESAQDHKRLCDGDVGPNTGGMGAYSPTPALSPALLSRALERIVRPTVRALAAEGTPFCGLLYAGLMIVKGEPFVLEYNCRFGDPETQAVLPRLAEDLVPLLLSCTEGGLREGPIRFRPETAVSVVLASEGYPGPVETGRTIVGIERAEAMPSVMVFHGGTRREDGQLKSAGGRVLNVTALGTDVGEARDRAYAAVREIAFQGMQYRRDIAAQAL